MCKSSDGFLIYLYFIVFYDIIVSMRMSELFSAHLYDQCRFKRMPAMMEVW